MRQANIPNSRLGVPNRINPVQPRNSPHLGVPQRPRNGVHVILMRRRDARVENSRLRVRAGVQNHHKRRGNKERNRFLQP